jgi:predicted permease
MSIWLDVRFALRLLWKDRWFSAVAAMALALGIGVNTAAFTIVNGILLRGLPFDRPDRIVALGTIDAKGRPQGASTLDVQDWQASAHSYASVAVVLGAPMNLTEDGPAPDQFPGAYSSQPFFSLIGQRPVLGRNFVPDDDRPGAAPVVMLSYRVWKNRYAGDPAIVGRVVKANSLLCTVVGVMPPDMNFPFNTDVWMPFALLPADARAPKRNVRNVTAIARLTDAASIGQARAELATIGAGLARAYPDTNKDIRATVDPFNDRVTGPQLKLILYSMMGAVAFVLLIACANVANLLLARSSARAREIAVRVALGASRVRIVRQLLVESLLLALAGGVAGLGLAATIVRVFDRSLSSADVGKPYWMTFQMDSTVFAFLAAVCVGTSLAFGLAPALHISKTDVNEVLKEAGGRSGTGGPRARRWTSALIVVELVLTLVLLSGAGFMMRSFLALYRMNLGAETSRVLTMRLFLPLSAYPRPDARAALARRLEERLHAVSAIQSLALTTNPPLFGGFLRTIAVQGMDDTPERRPEVTMVGITAGYFDTLGVRPLRGRTFADADGTPGHEAAIVNQRFVAMHIGDGDPLGRQITLFDSGPSVQPSPPKVATIVGVVPSIRQRDVEHAEPDPVVYMPYAADPQRNLTLMVRGVGDPGPLTAIVRSETRAVEPDVPLFGMQTLDGLLAQRSWPFRVFGTLFSVFAGIALALAAVGLYAVTAYSVTQRTPEIGVRMALGAQPRHVAWLVLRRALLHLAIGLPLGVAGAVAVGRLMESTLVEAGGRDPLTIAGIGLLMTLVALAACVWPARRATQLDPIAALRYE